MKIQVEFWIIIASNIVTLVCTILILNLSIKRFNILTKRIERLEHEEAERGEKEAADFIRRSRLQRN